MCYRNTSVREQGHAASVEAMSKAMGYTLQPTGSVPATKVVCSGFILCLSVSGSPVIISGDSITPISRYDRLKFKDEANKLAYDVGVYEIT